MESSIAPNFEIVNRLGNLSLLVHYQYSQCYRCLDYNLTVPAGYNTSHQILLWPHYTAAVKAVAGVGTNMRSCGTTLLVQEDTAYTFAVERIPGNESQITCTLEPAAPAMDLFYLLPLLVMFVLVCLASACYYAVLMMYRHRLFQRIGSRLFLYQVDSFEDLGSPRGVSGAVVTDDDDTIGIGHRAGWHRKRLRAVDTFRGLSVVLMVLVNYGGGQYLFLRHSIWNGLTVADLVFPWFTFVMGATVALSLFKMSLKKLRKLFLFHIWLRAIKRSILLFVIGLGLENRVASLSTLRVMGPLQRLAVAYFSLVSFICLVSLLERVAIIVLGAVATAVRRCCYRRRRTKNGQSTGGDSALLLDSSEINMLDQDRDGRSRLCRVQRHLADLVKCWPHIIMSCGLLATHALISLYVEVGPCPRGYLGPGGIADFGRFPNCTGGVAAAIDRIVLGSAHMYRTPTCKTMYNTTEPYDPEGILGCLTCTSLCFLGYWAGNVMLMNREWWAIVKRLAIYTAICTLAGGGLCRFSLLDGPIPINKNLWSASYVLVSAGTGFCLLALLFVMIDVLKIWTGAPFRYPGMNALVIYVGHEFLSKTFPVQWSMDISYSHTYYLLMNMWGAIFWTGIGFVMYVKKLFITV